MHVNLHNKMLSRSIWHVFLEYFLVHLEHQKWRVHLKHASNWLGPPQRMIKVYRSLVICWRNGKKIPPSGLPWMMSVNLLKVGEKPVHWNICSFYFCFPHWYLFSDVKYAVKEVTEGAEYEFRVSAINESGSGDPSTPSAIVCAKNPNSK